MIQILSSEHREVRGVLFDMDGVVIDSEKLYTRFWMVAAAQRMKRNITTYVTVL